MPTAAKIIFTRRFKNQGVQTDSKVEHVPSIPVMSGKFCKLQPNRWLQFANCIMRKFAIPTTGVNIGF